MNIKRIIWLGLAVIYSGACSEQAKPVNQNAGDIGGADFAEDDNQSVNGANAAFTIWCQNARETEVVQKRMGKYYKKFCSNGKPTSLFAKSLPAVAYSGTGTATPKKLAKTEMDGKYVIVSLGTAIKLPISIKDHFEKVGPKGGDAKAQERLGERQNAEVDVKITDSFDNDGKHHVRGWTVYTKTKQSESGINIVTETEARADQFNLKEGQAYMYTSYVTKAVKGIKESDLFTAAVQVGDSAYLITQAYIVADSKGAPQSLAEQMVLKTAKGLMESMYESAAKER